MIVVANRIRVAPGQEEAFEARFRNRAHLVDTMPGFIKNEVLRPIQSDYYTVLTYWETAEDFQRWTESPQFAEAHRSRLRSPDVHRGSESIGPPKEMLAGPNVFEMHEVILSTERRSA